MHLSVDLGNLVRETLHQVIGTQPNLIPFSLQIQPQLPRVLTKQGKVQTALKQLLQIGRDLSSNTRGLQVHVGELAEREHFENFPQLPPGEYIEISLKFGEPQAQPDLIPVGLQNSIENTKALLSELKGILNVGLESPKTQHISCILPLAPRSRGKILVADDEDLVLSMLSSALSSQGYQVSCARDGQEALDIFLAKKFPIALVLLDHSMPKLSGLELYTKIRSLSPQQNVILTSGFGAEIADKLPLDDPHTAFLSKPYKLPALFEQIESLLKV
jgi:CheY-like chemotaxis protein